MDYRSAGVDLNLGQRASDIMYEASVATFENRAGRIGEPLPAYRSFSGPLLVKELKDTYLYQNADGIGSKVRVAQLMDKHDTLGFDLLAMCCDDASVMGAEPVGVVNVLNMKQVDLAIVQQLATGLVRAAKEARVAVVGGEVAELGDMLNCPYTWDGACLAFGKRGNVESVATGDKIIGLRSVGWRCNGFSLLRAILQNKLGKNWVNKPYDHRTWGEIVLTPSLIFTPLLVDLFSSDLGIKKAAHVTGGGMPGNLRRVLPSRFGAVLEVDPPNEMLQMQEMGKVEDREAFSVWNMGIAILLVADAKKAWRALNVATQQGIRGDVVGEITNEPGISIKSQGKEVRL